LAGLIAAQFAVIIALAVISMDSIHQQDDWPRFRWDPVILAQILARVRHQQGRLTERMVMLGFKLRQEAVSQTLTQDVVKSSEIEGEALDPGQVRSSIARRLGMDVAGLVTSERNVEGIVEMMLDAVQRFGHLLTRERLFSWHAALFPTGRSGLNRITVGGWRNDQT